MFEDDVYRIYKENGLIEDFDISIHRNKMVMDRPTDWQIFKTKILPKLSTNCINIIVVHGGILRKNILKDCMDSLPTKNMSINAEIKNKDTKNLQSYLITYNNTSFEATDYEKKDYHLYNLALKDKSQKQLTKCDYSYRKNIKSEEEKKKEKKEEATKRNSSFYGINGFQIHR